MKGNTAFKRTFNELICPENISLAEILLICHENLQNVTLPAINAKRVLPIDEWALLFQVLFRIL